MFEQSKILHKFSVTVKSKDLPVTHQFVKLDKNLKNKEVTYVITEITNEMKVTLDNLGMKSLFIQTQRLQLNGLELDDPRYEYLERTFLNRRRMFDNFLEDFDLEINRSRIEEYADDLSRIIKLKRSNYFAESQDVEKNTLYEYLDKSISNSQEFVLESEIENIEKDISKMKNHMEKLLTLGIYEPDEVSLTSLIKDSKILDAKLTELKEFMRDVAENQDSPEYTNNPDYTNKLLNYSLKSSLLRSYAVNMGKKLDIFVDLEAKIEAFINNLNILKHKKVEVNLEKGFLFKIETGLETGKIINPKELSSGEQHEVILNYELIFKTENNSIILIDEPEISLHILWQRKYIDNLIEIAKANNLSIIVATHSPDIVYNHRKLVHVLSDIYCNEG